MIRTLMQNGDANQLKKGNKMVLKEFVSNENDCIKSEREAYMEAVHDNVIESLKRDCSPGQVDFIIDSWKKWQCKAEEIKSGEIKDEFGYLKYFEQIKQDYVLKDIVSNFIGRLMVDYVFSFNKNNFVLVDLNGTYVFIKIDYLTNIMDLLIHFCLARCNVLSAWELPITLHLISVI